MRNLAQVLIGRRAALALAACHAAVALVGCRAAPPPAADPFAGARQAAGGARWDEVAAIETTSTVAVGGLTGTASGLEDVRTGRYRTSLQLGAIAQAEGHDGAGAWEQVVGGEVIALDAPDAVARAATARWMVTRGYLRPGGAAVQPLGARAEAGRQFQVFRATPPGGAPIELWFAADDGQLARTVHRDGTQLVTTRYEDYRRVAGVAIAHRVVVDPGDPRNVVTSAATEVRVLPAVDEARLARPATDDARLSFATAAGTSQLPFELIHNHIYIRAAVDGKPVRLVVDTGGLNLLSPEAVARLGLTTAGKLAAGGGGAGQVDVGMARAKELAVGDVRLADPVFYVIDLGPVAANASEAFDGLVGFELFHRLAVRIDYPGRTLTLRARDRFTPPPGAGVAAFELRNRTPVARGEIDGIPARLQIDTGSNGSLLVTSPFARAHRLEERYRPTFELVTGRGVGGEIRAKPVRFGSIKLGTAEVRDVIGELATAREGGIETDPDLDGNLGGDILRRFIVSFDYAGRRLYLEPGPAVARDIYPRAGFHYQLADGALRVTSVTPDGPAARAGLVAGDRVLAVDGAAVATRSADAWREVLATGAVGARHTLSVERAGARRDVELVLRELIP